LGIENRCFSTILRNSGFSFLSFFAFSLNSPSENRWSVQVQARKVLFIPFSYLSSNLYFLILGELFSQLLFCLPL